MKHQAHKPTLLNGTSISTSHGHSGVVTAVEFFLLNSAVSVPGYMTLVSLIWQLLLFVYSCITLVQVVSIATVQHQM